MSALALLHTRSHPDAGAPVALVTGAARNIGLAIAGRLQTDGYQLVVTTYEHTIDADRPGGPASVGAAEAADLGAQHDWDVIGCDLADEGAVAELVSLVETRYGRLDCVVNNAATWAYGPALSISDAKWREVFEVNVLAIVRLVRAVHPLLCASPAARVVNLSSIGARWSGNGVAPYNVSKAAVSSLTRALATELADDRILVNEVAPGIIETSSNAHELNDPAIRSRRLALVPLGRTGTPEEVANVVALLASPALGFVTGSVVTIDGGQLAGARRGLIA